MTRSCGGSRERGRDWSGSAVRELLDFEDAHDPVLRSKHLLDRLELEVLMADLNSPHAVVAWRLTCMRFRSNILA